MLICYHTYIHICQKWYHYENHRLRLYVHSLRLMLFDFGTKLVNLYRNGGRADQKQAPAASENTPAAAKKPWVKKEESVN